MTFGIREKKKMKTKTKCAHVNNNEKGQKEHWIEMNNKKIIIMKKKTVQVKCIANGNRIALAN